VSEVKGKGTKERIRDVAIDLISEKGYNAVSIREIARQVDIAESSIYNHYKGKENIMDSIIEYLKEESKNILNEISINTFDPKILVKDASNFMVKILEATNIKKILRIVCIELYQNEKCLDFFKNQYVEPSYMFWTEIFKKMIENGRIMKKYDPGMLAREFYNYNLFLIFKLYLLDYNEATYDSLIKELTNDFSSHVQFFFEMISMQGKKKNSRSFFKKTPK